MNFPKSTIKKSLHIIPDSLKDGITGDAQVTIGYQIYNLAKLTHTTDGIANLQFGDYNVNKVGLYGKNIEIHADTGRLNEYATDDILIGSAGSKLRIGMYSSTMFNNGVNFMLMTPDVTKFIDKQVILTASNSYENANKVSINNVTTRYGGCLLVGDYNKAHIALDNFQIQAKEDGVNAADKLCLNPMGGSVYINYCQQYFTTITLNRIQGYNINHTVGKLYLNPAGGNVVLNSDKSRLIFATVNADESVKASIYLAKSTNGTLPVSFDMPSGSTISATNSFCIDSNSIWLATGSTYIKGASTYIEKDLYVYKTTILNADVIIRTDKWTTDMVVIDGSVNSRSAEIRSMADISLSSHTYEKNNTTMEYYPSLKFEYIYKKSNIGFSTTYNTEELKIKAGDCYVSNNIAYSGLIIGEDSRNSKVILHVIFNNDVFARYSAIINENLQVYGDTKLGNINNLDNFKALTVYGKSRFVGNGIELYYKTRYIDFHFGGNASSPSLSNDSSSDDYTARIIEETSGIITVDSKLKSTFITTSYGGSTGAPAGPVEGQLYFEYI